VRTAQRNPGLRHGLSGCLALAALLLVLTASYWHAPHTHDHDDEHHEHTEHSCPVCVAVHTPTSNGLTGDTAGVAAPALVGRTLIEQFAAAPALPLPVRRARGPPRA
jgi:hypothetical protein